MLPESQPCCLNLTKPLNLADLNILLHATMHNVSPEVVIHAIATIEKAESGCISFLANEKYLPHLATSKASVILMSSQHSQKYPSVPALIVADPRLALTILMRTLLPDPYASLTTKIIHPTAIIGKNCVIGKNVSIAAYCVLGDNVTLGDNAAIGAHVTIGNNCTIGANTKLFANVVLYDLVTIGENCVIQSHATLGSSGFGYALDANSQKWLCMPHQAGLVIGDDVEIGSGTCVDQGLIEPTKIAKGVIIDNLVQIGHNVEIGELTAIAGCSAIAGSTSIGKKCMIGGEVGIAGHLKIADEVIITAKSGVHRSLEQSGIYSSGLPVGPNANWRKNVVQFLKLDATIRHMTKRISQLEHVLTNGEQSEPIGA